MTADEIRKEYKCLHLADYSLNQKMCKAIEKLKELKDLNLKLYFTAQYFASGKVTLDEEGKAVIDTILNLIEKQQKEIVNRDKVIDKMAEELRYQNGMQQDDIFCVDICKGEKCNKEQYKDKIKQYFINKAEEK